MKLRNKKTGEIIPIEIHHIGGKCYETLAQINEEWEDYEEPKDFWYIDNECGVIYDSTDETLWNKKYDIKFMKAIGNYFNTLDEAEQAVEKLKAWKRLKDKGFKFTGWDRDPDFPGDFRLTAGDEWPCDDKDLNLLFGRED